MPSRTRSPHAESPLAREKPNLSLDEALDAIALYRAAVEALLIAQYDHELTAAHMSRTMHDPTLQLTYIALGRDLRLRTRTFSGIEPQWYASVENRLRADFEARDARNIEATTKRRQGRT